MVDPDWEFSGQAGMNGLALFKVQFIFLSTILNCQTLDRVHLFT